MFCENGKCKRGKKQCGLLHEVELENKMTGEKKVEERCAFTHMIDSLARIEWWMQQFVTTQEQSRDQKHKDEMNMSSIVGTGFVGLLHAFNENENGFKKAMKLLDRVAAGQPPKLE